MDFNDIKCRIERVVIYLNERYEDDIERHTSINTTTSGEAEIRSATFGGTENEILNKIFNIIHNLASLKDHLKNQLKLKGLNSYIIEAEINSNLLLQVLVDLDNQNKHGIPLKNPRSGKEPKVVRPRQYLGINPGSSGSLFMIDTITSIPSIYGGSFSIMLAADIIDNKGNLICSLDDLVNQCFDHWTKILLDKNILDEKNIPLLKKEFPSIYLDRFEVTLNKKKLWVNVSVLDGKVNETSYFFDDKGKLLVEENESGIFFIKDNEEGLDRLIDDLMQMTTKSRINHFMENATIDQIGVHYLEHECRFKLEKGLLKIQDPSRTYPIKEVSELLMRVKFRLSLEIDIS